MIGLYNEHMSDVFDKYHLDGAPFAAVLHRFSDIDHGDPHDHPWGFRSIILHGGYVERVFNRLNGTSRLIPREVGDSFEIPAKHIHRIEELPNGECWTLVLPRETERVSRFWQFRDSGIYSRAWHEKEWTLMS